MPSLAIPKGSTVLVTGANGYIGAHICDQLLHAGYKVRGSVRDEKKSEWMVEEFEKKYGSGEFQLVTVEDITKEGAFDEALKGNDADITFFQAVQMLTKSCGRLHWRCPLCI